MAAPNTPATTFELDNMPFHAYTEILKKLLSLQHKGIGSSVVNRLPPTTIPALTIKRPEATDLALNVATGKPAIPNRFQYPRKEPTAEDIAAALAQNHELTMWDLDMTSDAKKQFSDATREYETLAKDRKAEIIEANKNDSNCGTKILSTLGPRTMVQLENNAQYQKLLATPTSDEVQSTISIQIMNILYELFRSGSTADMASNFNKLFTYVPDDDATPAEIIQNNQRHFTAAFAAIADPITGLVSADDIHSLLLIHQLSKLATQKDYAKRTIHRCLTGNPTKLPSPLTIQTILI